jgi:hypothetical protein
MDLTAYRGFCLQATLGHHHQHPAHRQMLLLGDASNLDREFCRDGRSTAPPSSANTASTNWFSRSSAVKLVDVSNVKEIEEAVQGLSAAELAAFREWFAKFDADAWDRHIEADIAAGHLDALADEALEDLRAGRCTER